MLNKRKAKRQTPKHRQYLEGFEKVRFFSMLLQIASLNYSGSVKVTNCFFYPYITTSKLVGTGKLWKLAF